MNILIDNNLIVKITKSSDIKSDKGIDIKGMTLIPGLIDAHTHVSGAAQVDLYQDRLPESYINISSGKALEEMLMRGFTSTRDAGGADYGLSLALENKIIRGPRLFASSKALSQTSGHGDFRLRTSGIYEGTHTTKCGSSISIICDGVDSVRKIAREQLRNGASQLKIMAAGGVASPTDRVVNLQFSEEEIKAVVEEAGNAGTYVMAHVYTPEGIMRCVRLGVRSIEHGTLINDEAARLVRSNNAFVVPTLSVHNIIYEKGETLGFPKESLLKLREIVERSFESIRIARKNKVELGFGTDLLGSLMEYQLHEFTLRAKGGETPFETLNSATYVNSKLLKMEGRIGVISEGAFADIVAIKGNPLQDISIMLDYKQNMPLIIKNGEIVKKL
ncbi:MAG TPA: amidohydrolase [Lentisphaeria bacterium]|nr:amidohydrolase [Lentisphaeria bacterium]